MRKAGHRWDEAWWENPSYPSSCPLEETSEAMKQAGFRRGQYWAPPSEQLEWEKAAGGGAPVSRSPPSVPKKRATPGNLTRPSASKDRPRRPQSQSPEGSLPIGTPPPSPDAPHAERGILESTGPLSLGRTSPIHLWVITEWHIHPLSCAKLFRAKQAV